MAVPNGVLNELPETIIRCWDTAWGSTGGARHEGRPQAVVKADGDPYVYVGGNFNRIQDTSGTDYTRNNLVRYTASTGALDTSWNPDLNGQVLWMCLSADETTLFVVGDFTTVGSTTRNRLAAFSISTGSLTSHFSGFACNAAVDTCVIDGTSLYVGGHFTSIGGSTRNRAAKLDVSTTTVTVDASWNPDCSQPVVRNDLCIDGGTHKIALNLDPQGTVGGSGQHSLALVNSTTGAKYWGVNPTAGGGYVMRANDDHNGGQIYLGTAGSGGNKLYCFDYDGIEQWWFRGNGDVQGVGFWRGLVVVAKHDSMVAAVKNSSSYTQPGPGVFIVNKDGVLQPSPWRSQFLQGDSSAFGVLRCFGAWGFLESDFGCLIMTGEFGSVRNAAGTQTKNPAPWRIAQFNEGGTTTVPGTHGWSVGYWDGDWWGSTAGQTQNATVIAVPGAFSFAAPAPAVSAENSADVEVFAEPAQFNLTAAQPVIETNGIPVEVTAPAGQFSFAVGSHGVNTTSVTISLRRPKILKSQQKIVQQGQVER